MKPSQLKAEHERLAKVKLRKMARSIPDNARLTNILLRFDGPFQRDLYSRLVPHLKFKAAPLEAINGIV